MWETIQSNPVFRTFFAIFLGILISVVYIPLTLLIGTIINSLFLSQEKDPDAFVRWQAAITWVSFFITFVGLVVLVFMAYKHFQGFLQSYGIAVVSVMVALFTVFLISVVFIIGIITTLQKEAEAWDKAKAAGQIKGDFNLNKFFTGNPHGNPISPLFQMMFQAYNTQNEQIMGPMADSLKSIQESNQSFRGFFAYMRQNMLTNLQGVWKGIESQFQIVQKMVQSMMNTLLDTFYVYESQITALHYIYDTISPVVGEVIGVIEDITDIKGDFKKFGQTVEKGFEKAGQEAKKLADAAAGEAKKLAGEAAGEAKKLAHEAEDEAKKFANELVAPFKKAGQGIKKAGKSVGNFFKHLF